jgi:hypothetical protein
VRETTNWQQRYGSAKSFLLFLNLLENPNYDAQWKKVDPSWLARNDVTMQEEWTKALARVRQVKHRAG